MFKIEKRFTFPMGHRLSKHTGRCHSIHGHNFTVYVGIKGKRLNENDMLIDFSDLKGFVKAILDPYDHQFVANRTEKKWLEELTKKLDIRSSIFDPQHDYDPTAERLAQQLYYKIKEVFSKFNFKFILDYVTVYENENSKATFTEEI